MRWLLFLDLAGGVLIFEDSLWRDLFLLSGIVLLAFVGVVQDVMFNHLIVPPASIRFGRRPPAPDEQDTTPPGPLTYN